MNKSQRKNILYWSRVCQAQSIYDIPPIFWKYIGLDRNNENKLNFIIHILYTYNYEYCK
jgi:hypothetical protein